MHARVVNPRERIYPREEAKLKHRESDLAFVSLCLSSFRVGLFRCAFACGSCQLALMSTPSLAPCSLPPLPVCVFVCACARVCCRGLPSPSICVCGRLSARTRLSRSISLPLPLALGPRHSFVDAFPFPVHQHGHAEL